MLLQTYNVTTGSKNLNARHKAFCLRDERKICYITKGKSEVLQNQGGCLFCGEFRSLLSKLMLTHSLVAME